MKLILKSEVSISKSDAHGPSEFIMLSPVPDKDYKGPVPAKMTMTFQDPAIMGTLKAGQTIKITVEFEDNLTNERKT